MSDLWRLREEDSNSAPDSKGVRAVKRGRGRPKGSKNRLKPVLEREGVKVKKGRGRPKGTKNRFKGKRW